MTDTDGSAVAATPDAAKPFESAWEAFAAARDVAEAAGSFAAVTAWDAIKEEVMGFGIDATERELRRSALSFVEQMIKETDR